MLMFILKIIYIFLSFIIATLALLTANFPPWDFFWATRALLVTLVGSSLGVIAGVILPEKNRNPNNILSFQEALPLLGLSVFWALIITSFVSYQNPANTSFNIPSWAELYLFILYISCAITWFWWRWSNNAAIPGLFLVMLAGTADGMLFDHFHISSTCLYLAMVSLWSGLIWIKYGIPSLRNPVFGGGLLLIGITLVASIVGVNPGDSLTLVLRLLSGWMIATGILTLRTDEKNELPFKLSLISSGYLIVLLTLIRYIFLFSEIGFSNSIVTRLTMVKADYNALGSAMILPLAVMITLKDKFASRYKLLFWVLIFLLLIPIFLSYTKSVWLGVGGLLTLGIVLTRKSWKRYLLVFCSVIIIVTIIALVYPTIGGRILNLDSVTSREVIWQTAVRAIADRPVLGYGPFNRFIHAGFARALPFDVFYYSRTFINVHTHNLWLEITEGTGFVGLLCFIAVLVISFRSSTRKQSWIAAGLVGLLITLTFMGGISSFNLIPFELWILLALLTNPTRMKAGWFGLPITIALTLSAIGISAEFYERNAQEEIRKGDLTKARADISLAERLNPLSLDYKGTEACIEILEDDFAAALKAYDQCVALAPTHPIWRAKRGVGRIIAGDYDGAVSDLEIAAHNDYYGVLWLGDLHAPLAAALAMVGANEKVRENLAISAGIDPTFPQNPFSALVRVSDGYECSLCPDFSPQGAAFERYLRCKNWLLYYSFPSITSFRIVYPANYEYIPYTELLQQQLSSFNPTAYPDVSSIPKRYCALGSAFYYARVAEGRMGSDLAAIFGSTEDIPPTLIMLLTKKAGVIDILGSHHIFSSLGLAISATQNGKRDFIQPLLKDAIESTNSAFKDEAGIKARRFTIERNSLIPIETPQLILFKADAYQKAGRIDESVDAIKKLVVVLMMEGGGIYMAEDIASILYKSGATAQPTMQYLESEFGAAPLVLLINEHLSKLRGDTTAAVEFAQRAGREEQNNRPLQLIVIYELLNLNDAEGACRAAREYLDHEPCDIDGLSNIAARLSPADNGNISKAILDHLKLYFPYSPYPYILEATLAEQVKDEMAQYNSLRKALSLMPTNMEIVNQLIRLSIARRDYYYSQQLITQGLNQNPGNMNLWMARVDLALQMNQQADALKYAQFAHNLYPNDPWATTTLAAQLFNFERLDEALAILNKFLEDQPDNSDAIHWRVKVLKKLGRSKEAQVDCEKMLSAGDADMSVYVEVANLRMEQNRPQEALRLMQQATDLYPNDSWGWATLGDIARRTKDFDLARMALDKALALAPDNESYRTLRQNVEKLPLADLITDCEKTLAAGDKPGALQKAEAAVHQYPAESWAWANLAYMAHEAGNKQRAIVAINKAIALAPNNKTWQKLRQEIEKQ